MRTILPYGLILFSVFFWSCNEDEADLPSVEDRIQEAKGDLTDLLTAPQNGWKLNYRPVEGAGSYFMILDFEENGSVRIQSDLAADEGEYYDQTITYRIDAALNLELIFENYTAFHYLFELEQGSFGGEFEFIYQREQDGNLYFRSKSDFVDITVIELIPATSGDRTSFSRDIAANFQEFSGQSPRLFGGVPPTQQLYFADRDISLFWSIDLNTRNLLVDVAGKGSTITEIISNGSMTTINHFTGYIFKNGQLVLDESFTATVDGTEFTLSEITMGDFSMTGASLCDLTVVNTPVYTGTESMLGAFTMTKSLFNSSGMEFNEQEDRFYSVNVLFVIDDAFNSLSETGSIAAGFPEAVAFVMTYGYVDDELPAYSVGLLVENEDNSTSFFLREFEASSTVGNKSTIKLLDTYYYSGTPTAAEEQNLMEITDEIFVGETLYAFELGIENLTAFQLYNPCNDYELVLVK